jgi:thiol:disulfide interchange protein
MFKIPPLEPLRNLVIWLIDVVALLWIVTSPIIGLIVVFTGWKFFFRNGRRKLGTLFFAAGAIVTIAGVTSLATPGIFPWLYASFRDLNPFS